MGKDDTVGNQQKWDTFVDGLFAEDRYRQEKRRLELDLESLFVPEVSAAAEAGRLLLDLPALWQEADLEERRKLLIAMLDAVYVDAEDLKRIVGVQPKPAFRPIFQVATTREGSGVILIKEPPEAFREASVTSPCSCSSRGQQHPGGDALRNCGVISLADGLSPMSALSENPRPGE